MAYVTRRNGGTWELRESLSTPKGPRSRTLASFRTLSDETIERARERATKPLSVEDARKAARRAGAPVDLAPADRAASQLLRELAAGREPHPILRGLLAQALGPKSATRLGDSRRPTQRQLDASTAEVIPIESLDNARASAAWLTASPVERGDALYDLLLLADRFPRRSAKQRDRFPRLDRAA